MIKLNREFEQVSQWLNKNIGKPVTIKKLERQIGGSKIDDQDRVELTLEDISIRHIEIGDPDNYVPTKELILHGNGTVHSKEGTVPLPQEAFEIPIVEGFSVSYSQDKMDLETNRAVYSIKSGH